jgi:UDP-N-acetylmuramoylalanine--D-glutamate ligase
MFDDLADRRVTVFGLGRFGGGIGAVRFLVSRGARVTVTDRAGADELADSLAQIGDVRIEKLRLGGHDESDFRDADLVVASPAVPGDHPLLAAAEAAGVTVTTEIGLFWSHCRGRIIGVTGSVGKSTTATMIHAILRTAGWNTRLGGNIGGSLLPDVARIAADDWVVLELSSFQLERLAPLKPRPRVAVVTNFHANHLDRHGTLEAYRAAKQNLLRWQTADDVAVLNAGDADVAGWPTKAQIRWFDELVAIVPELHVPGAQYRLDAAAAVAAAVAVGVDLQTVNDALNAFRGLPHRQEIVGEFDGRLWVNDSKATTPEATIAALESFERPIRLIAGGADKGADFARLADAILRRGVVAYLCGQTGPSIAGLLAERGHSRFTLCASFDACVETVRRESHVGDVILLSPACASWEQFRDYRERGERFRRLARLSSTGSHRPEVP